MASARQRAGALAQATLRTPANAMMACVFAFACLHALVSLWFPFGWDHAILASVGDAIARGGLPYRDGWDMKGPVAYLPFALAEILFGRTMWGERLIDLAIQVPALFFLYRTLRAQTSHLVAAGAVLLLYLWLASADWFFTAQPEDWVTMMSIIACGLMLRSEAQTPATVRAMVLCGVLIACAGLIKPLYLAFGLVPLSYLATELRLSLVRRAVLAAWLAFATAATIALVIGVIALLGGLDAFIEVELRYTLGSYGGAGGQMTQGLGSLLANMWAYAQQGPTVLVLPFAALGLWMRRGEPRILAPLLAWLFAALFCVAIQGRLFVYQWFPLFAPLMVCAAFGAQALAVSDKGGAAGRAIVALCALFVAAQAALNPAREIAWWARMGAGSNAQYLTRFQFQTYVASDEVLAAQYIRDHTRPEEGMFVWGIDATVAFLSDRPNPSRFTFNMPLSSAGTFREAYRQEVLTNLAAAPPTYIVVGSPWQTYRTKEDTLGEFPEFAAVLRNGYALERSFGYVDLYRRNATSAAN